MVAAAWKDRVKPEQLVDRLKVERRAMFQDEEREEEGDPGRRSRTPRSDAALSTERARPTSRSGLARYTFAT